MDLISATFKEFWGITQTMGQAFQYTWFIVLPLFFYYLFRVLWMEHIWIKYLKSIDYVLLEIVPPREIEKSPRLMESFFSGFAGAHKGFSTQEAYIKGELTARLTIEIVGDGGAVHFYLRTPKTFQSLVEANLYAQYPDVQIFEVPDYVSNVPKLVPNEKWDLWGTDIELVKSDVYPIKTYKFFEETVTGKMLDPLSAMLEVLSTLPPNQKIWFQMVTWPLADSDEAKEGKKIVEELAGRTKKSVSILEKIIADLHDIFKGIFSGMFAPVEYAKEEKKDEAPLEFRLTPGEKDVMKALEENIGKHMYGVKMRFLVLGPRENFSKAFISSFFGTIKQFNDNNLNSFKPNDTSKTRAEYVFVEQRLRYRQRKIFQRYIDRDPTGKTFKLSSAELATIFHMPDMSVVAPSLTRVDAKRGGAPSNLPIE